MRTENGIGDFVLFSASLPAYRKLFENSHIILMVSDETFNLAETCPYVDEVWKINVRNFRRRLIDRIKWMIRVREGNFDVALNTSYAMSSSYLRCLIGWTGAPRRIAHLYINKFGKRTRKGIYYTELVPNRIEWKFEVDRNFDMLRYLGYEGTISRDTEVWLTDTDREYPDKAFPDLGYDYAVLVPGARYDYRSWSGKNFVDAIKKISQNRQIKWLVCGSHAEAGICSKIANDLRSNSIDVADLSGGTTLRELASVFSRAKIYLGNETGPAHISCALKIPSVIILGGGHYGRFFPYPENSTVYVVTNRLDCYNCYWRCIRREVECITKIGVDQVVVAVETILGKTAGISLPKSSLSPMSKEG